MSQRTKLWIQSGKIARRWLTRLLNAIVDNIAAMIAVAILFAIAGSVYGMVESVQGYVNSVFIWFFTPARIPEIQIAPWLIVLIALLIYLIYLLIRRLRRKAGEYFDFEYMGLEWRTYLQSGHVEDLPYCPAHPGVQYAESPDNIYTTPKYYAFKCPMADKHSEEVHYALMKDRYSRAVKVARSILQNELPSPPIVRRGNIRQQSYCGDVDRKTQKTQSD